MLLTRFKTLRLRFAMIPVSHTHGNCASGVTQPAWIVFHHCLVARRVRPAGAKARVFPGPNGTAEAVPFPKLARIGLVQQSETGQARLYMGSSASSEAMPYPEPICEKPL